MNFKTPQFTQEIFTKDQNSEEKNINTLCQEWIDSSIFLSTNTSISCNLLEMQISLPNLQIKKLLEGKISICDSAI